MLDADNFGASPAQKRYGTTGRVCTWSENLPLQDYTCARNCNKISAIRSNWPFTQTIYMSSHSCNNPRWCLPSNFGEHRSSPNFNILGDGPQRWCWRQKPLPEKSSQMFDQKQVSLSLYQHILVLGSCVLFVLQVQRTTCYNKVTIIGRGC